MGWTAGAGVRECAGRACERAHSACVRLNPSPRPPTHAATFTPSAPPRALAQPRALHPLVSSPSHTEMIFGLAVDAARGLVVRCAMNANSAWELARRPARPHPPTHPPAHSPTNPPTPEPTHAPNHALWSPPACSGGKDSFLQVWTAEGQPLQRLDLGDRLGGGRWGGTGGWGAARRAMPDTTGFLTAETVSTGGQTQHVVRFWDVGAGGSFHHVQPTQVGSVCVCVCGVGGGSCGVYVRARTRLPACLPARLPGQRVRGQRSAALSLLSRSSTCSSSRRRQRSLPCPSHPPRPASPSLPLPCPSPRAAVLLRPHRHCHCSHTTGGGPLLRLGCERGGRGQPPRPCLAARRGTVPSP